MADIHIYTEDKGPRALYVLNHVFARMLGWSVEWLQEKPTGTEEDRALVCYAKAGNAGFHVVPSGKMTKGEALQAGSMVDWNGHTVLFPTECKDLPFDLFAFAFFLLSRAEEYSGPKDEHGRFDEAHAWVVQLGLEQQPLLDEVVLAFAAMLRKRWPSLPEPRRGYSHVATFDLDNGFKYQGREWWRSLGSAFRDLSRLKFRAVLERIAVLSGTKADPFGLEERILETAKQAHSSYCFVIAADRGPHDHAVPVEDARMKNKIGRLAEHCAIGLHPSYGVMKKEAMLGQELERLVAVINEPVHASRQHFLRFRLPDTFRALHAHGIGEEHSMGFSRRAGFRAGTCTPFPWYDLEAEEQTNLMIHPFCLMDSAVDHYCRSEKKMPLRVYQKVISNVRSVKGTCEMIWHERFIAGDVAENEWDRIHIEATRSAEGNDQLSGS